MAFDLEALIGHLYIVSGRSINAAPPGMLVEAAPRKAARGREMDTFFTLVLASGHHPAPATFYEGMAQLAAEKYFESTGSVTAGVRSVFNTLNRNLFEHNESSTQPYEANMICGILHGTDLFLARVGGGVAVLYTPARTEYFPATFDNDDALYGPPLGVEPIPNIKMTQYRLTGGARLALADNTIADLVVEHIQTALVAPNLGDVILSFKTLATGNLTLLMVEFVGPDTPDLVASRTTHSTRAGATDAIKAEKIAPAPAATTNRQKVNPTSYRLQKQASSAAIKLADSVDSVNTIIGKMSEESPARPNRFSPLLNNSSVVLIPVALVVLVLILWLTETGDTEFEQCVTEANDGANMARSIASNDVTGTLAAWNAVLLTVERCDEIRPDDVELSSLTREGQGIIDQLNQITRREAIPIEAFPNATLKSTIIRGEDLYVLDDANDQVYRISLTEDGLSMVNNSRLPIASMRRGAGVGQYTLDDIVDITWSEDGSGLSQGNVLLAMDKSGVLVEYSPTFLARGVQKLLGTEQWESPIKITTWRGRLYVLDPAADQIWRYDPSGGAFPGTPQEYFTGARRPTLTNAVDFAIDDTGRVYVLFADGVIAMFRLGEEQRFGFAAFPPNQPLETANAMYLNNNVLPGIYIVDRSRRTLIETTLAGTWINAYRTFDETQFDLLTDVATDENKRLIYVTSGNTILGFPK